MYHCHQHCGNCVLLKAGKRRANAMVVDKQGKRQLFQNKSVPLRLTTSRSANRKYESGRQNVFDVWKGVLNAPLQYQQMVLLLFKKKIISTMQMFNGA
jgi:hypothetical protein